MFFYLTLFIEISNWNHSQAYITQVFEDLALQDVLNTVTRYFLLSFYLQDCFSCSMVSSSGSKYSQFSFGLVSNQTLLLHYKHSNPSHRILKYCPIQPPLVVRQLRLIQYNTSKYLHLFHVSFGSFILSKMISSL